jgi:single-stranded-DNA-specific exonuclease
LNQAKEQLQDEFAHEKILITKNKKWHPGIVGLIAGRLTEEYHRPSIIFHEQEDGKLVASARSTEKFNIVQALTKHKDLLLRFGGHSQAAGCTIEQANYQTFCEQMRALADETLTDDDLYPILAIDCELQPEQMTIRLKREIDALEPYGKSGSALRKKRSKALPFNRDS